MRMTALAVALLAAPLGCGGNGGGTGGSTTTSSSTSTTATTSTTSGGGAGGATSSTSTASTGGAGGTGGQGGAPCVNTDPGEPNDSEDTAYSFGDTGCSDSDPGMIYGILDGPDDVDWFTYVGMDDTTCLVNPTQGVTVVGAGSARLCAYFECTGGSGTDPGTCPSGTIADTSPDGRPGCCGHGDFTVDLNCTGTIDDSSAVYLRVDDPTHQAVCLAYTVSFHY